MFRFWLAALLLGAVACSSADNGEPHTGPDQIAKPAGQAAYERACARCHDEGIDGAPAIGDRQAWASRSPLWVAVLAEHAKDGYLDMPAKGGDPDITDEEVAAAAEYMLTVTHPDRLPD